MPRDLGFPVFDADNHLYETRDALTKYLPAEYKDAIEVLKKTENDVIPRIEDHEDRRELEELCRQVRLAMGSGDKKHMEDARASLNDRLLNYAYLLSSTRNPRPRLRLSIRFS